MAHKVNQGTDIQNRSDQNEDSSLEMQSSSPLLNSRRTNRNKHQDMEDDRRKRSNMICMIIICGLSMLGYGIYGAAYDQWIYVRAKDPCFQGNESESPFKTELLQAQANAARFSVWTMVCCLIPSLFTNMLLGVFSDQIGRRLIFIAFMAGNFVRVAITCAVAFWDLNVYYILIGSFVIGLSGDFSAFFMAMYVYTADNTSEGKNRSLLMIFAEAITSMCYYVTQFVSGYYIEAEGYVWPMVTGLGLLFLCLVLTLFLIRETLDKSQVQRIGLVPGIKNLFSFYYEAPENPLYKRRDFLVLGLVIFVYGSSMGSKITTMFLMSEPFCWRSRRLGYLNSSFGFGNAVLCTGLMKLLQMFMGDELVAVFSHLVTVAYRFIFAFADYNWQIYIAYAVASLELPVLPIMRSIMSRMIRPNQRGSLFATVAVIQSVTFAVSGAGLNELYASTVDEWKGLTYFVIGCIVMTSALLLFIYKINLSRRLASNSVLLMNAPAEEHTSKTIAKTK
ncbi:proton-coupled folate transporter-like [Plakobranchus ocellatus]|uniref:Proton-coupled folate transporter-like n=1 Tax=Plakobranchus ocellatus TaxID=259542 RepID=A0AAV4A9Z9_9GAST|nr:proton-coupled folate transporter-like [Plakobranchus ocellatus]